MPSEALPLYLHHPGPAKLLEEAWVDKAGIALRHGTVVMRLPNTINNVMAIGERIVKLQTISRNLTVYPEGLTWAKRTVITWAAARRYAA